MGGAGGVFVSGGDIFKAEIQIWDYANSNQVRHSLR